MGLLRRNKPDKKGEQAVPTEQTVPTPAAGAKKPQRGLIGGIRQYLIDTYNGLYRVTLKPHMPSTKTILLLIVGLVFGLIWGYLLQPTIFYGGSLNQTSQAWQDQWIKSAAVAADSQITYDDTTVFNLLRAVPAPAESINRMLQDPALNPADQQALARIQAIAQQVTDAAPRIERPGLGTEVWNSVIIPLLIVIIVTPIAVLLWGLILYPILFGPIWERIREATNANYRAQRQKDRAERARIVEQKKAAAELKKEAAQAAIGSELGAPVKQAVFIYSKGRNFDESTEIELETGEFLGQCGAVIAEAVDPDPVALEIWLFDMFSQQNLRKVFITEAAYNNPSIRAKIEDSVDNPAQDIIVAAPNAAIVLESDKLRLQSKLLGVAVGADGRFEELKMSIQAWQKDARKAAVPAPMSFAAPAAPAPAPARPLSDYDDLAFDPPPAPPSKPSFQPLQAPPPAQPAARPLSDYDNLTFDPPPVPPSKPSLQPLKPPPMTTMPQPPGFDDDDPFGGTGDFTPLSPTNR